MKNNNFQSELKIPLIKMLKHIALIELWIILILIGSITNNFLILFIGSVCISCHIGFGLSFGIGGLIEGILSQRRKSE